MDNALKSLHPCCKPAVDTLPVAVPPMSVNETCNVCPRCGGIDVTRVFLGAGPQDRCPTCHKTVESAPLPESVQLLELLINEKL